MDKEVWKPIKGFEGAYEVSTFGNVRSIDRIVVYPKGSKRLIKGRELRQATNIKGYKLSLIHISEPTVSYTHLRAHET